MSKKCFKCDEVKELSDFYRHKEMSDGYLNKCKECTKVDSINNRNNNLTKVREYDIIRAKLPHRVEQRKKYLKQWRLKNPEKYKAHTTLNNALRDGKIQKAPCEVCGSIEVHGHHEDYNKPLEVTWLCPVHHKEIHK